MSKIQQPVDESEGDERNSRRANAIDVHVGSRVRLRRMLLGMSQEKLGEQLGLTFQQVQKYEKGVNRIGAGRLFDLSHVLGVPCSFSLKRRPPTRSKAQPWRVRREVARGKLPRRFLGYPRGPGAEQGVCADHRCPRSAARSSISCAPSLARQPASSRRLCTDRSGVPKRRRPRQAGSPVRVAARP